MILNRKYIRKLFQRHQREELHHKWTMITKTFHPTTSQKSKAENSYFWKKLCHVNEISQNNEHTWEVPRDGKEKKERNLNLKDTKTRAKVMRPEINCIAANTINHTLRSLTPLHASHFVIPTKKNEKRSFSPSKNK